MADCECLEGCPFFNDNMNNMPATAELMKQRFCLGNNRTCTKYMVYQALGGSKVPTDLFSNYTERASTLLSTQ